MKNLKLNMGENSNEKIKKIDEISLKIIQLSRNQIFVEQRFLESALSFLEFEKYDGQNQIYFSCDGNRIYYNSSFVLREYEKNKNNINRMIIHTLLHFVYHHNITGVNIDYEIWNLACDIAVENTINNFKSDIFRTQRITYQQKVINDLKLNLKYLNAESIYKYYKNKNLSFDELAKLRLDFKSDEHNLWLHTNDEHIIDDNVDMIKIWQDVSKKVQTEIETMDDYNDELHQNLQIANRNKKSYSEFLKKFGMMQEVLKISDDEFDVNYYTYGMNLYKNIPLIENLEYKEDKTVKDFIIAIDTSGSVKGDIVEKFVQKTYDILKGSEIFGVKTRLHIIQCDYKIREDVIITSEKDFDKYIKTMQIKGFGETDFRPVFEYVDSLIQQKKLNDVSGLLYFTDGQGIYPKLKPPYNVAFVVYTDEVYPPEVPAFAIRFLIEEDMN